MPELERQLRAYCNHLDDTYVDVTFDEIVEGFEPAIAPIRRRPRRMVAALAAAAIVLLLIGGVAVAMRILRTDVVSEPPVPTTTIPAPTTTAVTPTTTPSAGPRIPVPTIEFGGFYWSRLPPELTGFTRFGNEFLTEVAFGDSTFVIVGWEETRDGDAVVVTSADGTDWTRISDPEALGGEDTQQMLAVTYGDDQFVAVGWDEGIRSGVVWTSSDGSSWQRLADEQPFETTLLTAVAYGPNGFVAAGRVDIDASIGVWHSPDAQSWTQVAAFDPGDLPIVNDIASGPMGYVAVGLYEIRDGVGEGEAAPAIWFSPDGIEWNSVALEGPSADWDGQQFISGVAYSEVHGFRTAGDPLWASVDGETWVRSPLGSGFGWAIAFSEDGQLALAVGGGNDPMATPWISTDGQTFQQVPPDPTVFGSESPFGGTINQWMTSVEFGNGTAVMIGADTDVGSAIWVATPEPLGLMTTEPPPTTTTTVVSFEPVQPEVLATEVGIQFAIGDHPCAISATVDAIWVGDCLIEEDMGGRMLRQVDPGDGLVLSTIDLGIESAPPEGYVAGPRSVSALAVAPDVVWLTGDSVGAVDSATGEVVSDWRYTGPVDVAVGDGTAWVWGWGDTESSDWQGGGLLTKLDAASGDVLAEFLVQIQPDPMSFPGFGVEAVGNDVWVLLDQDDEELFVRTHVAQIDPNTGEILQLIDISPVQIFFGWNMLASGEGGIWVIGPEDCFCKGRVVKIDPDTGEVLLNEQVGVLPTAMALGGGYVWFLDEISSEPNLVRVLRRLDPNTGQLVDPAITFTEIPTAIAADDDFVWVTHSREGLLTRIEIGALP